jgi:nitroreductase/FMN reductase [NAD(P)H]
MTTVTEMIGDRFAIETDRGSGVAASETIQGLLSRRSLRRYDDREVPDELLDVLLACAQSAPTKSNLQQYSIVVVADPEDRARLQPLCPATDWLATCPVFLVFCADMRRNQRIAGFRGYPHENNNTDTFLNAVVDAALAMQCFITAAESAGLGCAPISEVRNRIAELSDVLGLPDGVFPISGLTAGWPAQPGYVNQRLPSAVVVHRDRYDDANLEAEIEDYDRRRHEIFPVPPRSQRHTDKYGVAEICTWSENVARQLSIPERAGFRDFLTSRGFDLA